MASKARTRISPAWHDVREYKRMPSRRPDEQVIGERLEAGDLFEYVAPEPSVEAKDFETDHQGVALAYQSKASRATKLGTYFEGAHVTATDSTLDRYLAGNDGLGARSSRVPPVRGVALPGKDGSEGRAHPLPEVAPHGGFGCL